MKWSLLTSRQKAFARLYSNTDGRVPLVENINFGLFLEELGQVIDPPTKEGIREAVCHFFGVTSTASIPTEDMAQLITMYDKWREKNVQ